MTTTVGKENTIETLVSDLISLERDAVAAYETAIEKLSDRSLAMQVEQFLDDHRQHLKVLNEMALETGADASSEGDMKQWLTTGKVSLGALMGDAAILKAMKSNENDTVTAYERAATHGDALAKSRAFFEKALADEQRHRDWFTRTAEAV